jgi:protein-S-isoprenylcysteine O-methyltransferase Ste14
MARRLLRQWESPPTWLALFLALAWAQAQLLPVLDAGATGRALGAGLIVAGLAVMALAVTQFRRHRTSVLPRETPVAMIDTGLYRWSRNPIYLADAMILSGAALRWDMGGLILVPLYMAVILHRFIRGEEAGLRAAFGPAFDAYAARTRRWL